MSECEADSPVHGQQRNSNGAGDESSDDHESNQDGSVISDILDEEDRPDDDNHELNGYEDHDDDDLRDAIKDALDEIDNNAEFSCFIRPQYFVDPHLCVGGSERPIRFPLQAEDAQKVIAASRAAPFGLGRETIVDQSVRKNLGDRRRAYRNMESYSIRGSYS